MVHGLRDLHVPNPMAQGLYHLIVIQMVKKSPDSVKCIDMDLYGITTEYALNLLCLLPHCSALKLMERKILV